MLPFLLIAMGIATGYATTDRESADAEAVPFVLAAATSRCIEHGFRVTASSCSPADIRAAVAAVQAAGDGIVSLPPGNCTHSTAAGDTIRIPNGIRLIGSGQDQTVIRDANIQMDGRSGGLPGGLRISGMTLAGDSHIGIRAARDFRLDHITIHTSSSSAISIVESHAGVVDHNFVQIQGSYYGVMVSQGYDGTFPESWVESVSYLLGSGEAIFIEDNEFTGAHHGTVGHGNAHYVARRNIFRDSDGHPVDAHGPGYGPPLGTRLVEAYDNIFYGDPGTDWKAFGIRGGSAVIFHNAIHDFDNGVMLTLESRAADYAEEMRVRDVWIWDNTFTNLGAEYSCPGDFLGGYPHCNEVLVWDIGSTPGMYSVEYIREGQEYFLRPPSQAEDGFTYESFAYPHPLASCDADRVVLSATPGNQSLRLDWALYGELDSGATWMVEYSGGAGLPPSPIVSIEASARSLLLACLSNYHSYTITITAVGNTQPFSDRVTAFPSDIQVFLPQVNR